MLAGMAIVLGIGPRTRTNPHPTAAGPPVLELRTVANARLLVHDGEIVEKGQLLARGDSTGLIRELDQAQSDLRALTQSAQSAITPITGFFGMAGNLPRSVGKAEIVKISTAPSKAAASPQAVSETDAAKGAKSAADDALGKATLAQGLSAAKAAEAQATLDALRPQEAQAEADAKRASDKLAAARSLLEAGAISRKELAESEQASTDAGLALDGVRQQISQAEQNVATSEAAIETAKKLVQEAASRADAASRGLAKSASDPTPAPAPAAPVRTERIVTRMPLRVHSIEPPAIPVKVIVDEKAIATSEGKAADLRARIEALKAEIAAAKVYAPISGIVRISPDGRLSIQSR